MKSYTICDICCPPLSCRYLILFFKRHKLNPDSFTICEVIEQINSLKKSSYRINVLKVRLFELKGENNE